LCLGYTNFNEGGTAIGGLRPSTPMKIVIFAYLLVVASSTYSSGTALDKSY